MKIIASCFLAPVLSIAAVFGTACNRNDPKMVSGTPALAVTASAAPAGQINPEPPQKTGYANFVAKIAELSPKYDRIFLADSNHSSVAIREFRASHEVMQALGRHGPFYIMEGGIEQNEPYQQPKIAADAIKIRQAFATITSIMAADGMVKITTGTDQDIAMRNSGPYINRLKTSMLWGWANDKDGYYSDEFHAHLMKKVAQYEKSTNFAQQAQSVRQFAEAMKYAMDAGATLQKRTRARSVYDLCVKRMPLTRFVDATKPLYQAMNSPGNARRIIEAEGRFYLESCDAKVEIFSPDHRHGKTIVQDPEFDRYMKFLFGSSTGDAVYDTIYGDAALDADPGLMAGYKKLETFLEESYQPGSDKIIADNIRNKVKTAKISGMYGADHFFGRHNLDEYLGRKGTAVILLLEGPESVILSGRAVQDQSTWPHFVYEIKTDAVWVPREEPERYLSHVKNKMSREDYDRAVKLMAEKKPEMKPRPFEFYDSKGNKPVNIVAPSSYDQSYD